MGTREEEENEHVQSIDNLHVENESLENKILEKSVHSNKGERPSGFFTRRIDEASKGERLAVQPPIRIAMATGVAGLVGFATGLQQGARHGGLQFLAENAHRMPRTKGGWYFYHKRKNYVLMNQGLSAGFKRAAKYGTVTCIYFGLEAYFDKLRGVIDFGNTVASSAIVGVGYGLSTQPGLKNALRSSRAFVMFGITIGLVQDAIRHARGNEVWYLGRWRHHENKL